MWADEDGWTDSPQVIVWIIDLDLNIRPDAHTELEHASNSILRGVLGTKETKGNGGEDAVERAEHQGYEVGAGAGGEGGAGDPEDGERVEGYGCAYAGEPRVGEVG